MYTLLTVRPAGLTYCTGVFSTEAEAKAWMDETNMTDTRIIKLHP